MGHFYVDMKKYLLLAIMLENFTRKPPRKTVKLLLTKVFDDLLRNT